LFAAALIAGGCVYAEPLKQAVWVVPAANSITPNPIDTATGRAVLISTSAASDVTDLYVSVYQSTPNTAGRLMYQDADIAELIRLAHSRRIKIWAAYGNSDWPALGCSAASFPLSRMAEVTAYNSTPRGRRIRRCRARY
jgi:hypothetical protein